MTNLTTAYRFYLDGMTTFNEFLHSVAKPGQIVFFNAIGQPYRINTYIGSWIVPAYQLTQTGHEQIA